MKTIRVGNGNYFRHFRYFRRGIPSQHLFDRPPTRFPDQPGTVSSEGGQFADVPRGALATRHQHEADVRQPRFPKGRLVPPADCKSYGERR